MDYFPNFAAIKENEEDLQVLIWETLQDTQSGKRQNAKQHGWHATICVRSG